MEKSCFRFIGCLDIPTCLFNIMTLRLTSLCTRALFIMIISITIKMHETQQNSAQYHSVLSAIMLSVVLLSSDGIFCYAEMLSGMMKSVLVLNVVKLRVIMLSISLVVMLNINLQSGIML